MYVYLQVLRFLCKPSFTMLCPSFKYGEIFFSKRTYLEGFSWRSILGKIYGEGYMEGLQIKSNQDTGTKRHFPIICKSVNRKSFTQPCCDIHMKIKLSQEL